MKRGRGAIRMSLGKHQTWRFEHMKRISPFLVAAVMLCMASGASPEAKESTDESTCPLIERALKDYQQVKNASSRKEVAKYFVPDGGMQFPAKTRYVYPRCSYLHVDVEFELVKPAEIAALPDDKVIGVSKLYVDYATKD
jgi:hypothetical protein